MSDVRTFQKHIKKPAATINTRLANLKKNLKSIHSHNHVRRKAVFVSICILTLICLAIVIEDFGSIQNVVRADSMVGKGVGIYDDKDCTNTTRSLDWGLINPNSNNSLTIFVRNERNSTVSLWLQSSNWVPSNSSNYMSLNWNYSGQILKENEVIPIKLTLTVSPKAFATDFSFETTITAVNEN
jgi:hypothetical protein